jgi:hypothetical protein
MKTTPEEFEKFKKDALRIVEELKARGVLIPEKEAQIKDFIAKRQSQSEEED